MEKETQNYFEDFMNKFFSQKSRMLLFVFALASAMCSIVYMATVKLSGVMVLYMYCILLASVANIVYAVDVEKKNKYAGDIMVGGMALGFFGMVIRTIRLGITFSWKYWIAYLIFAFAFLLLITKCTKNSGKENLPTILLIIMAAYSIFEIFHSMSYYVYGGFSWVYYRIAEALLFIDYVVAISILKSEFEQFAEGIGSYKKQIPGIKITAIILVFVAVVSLVIGGLVELGNQKNTVTTTESIVTEDEEEKPKTNKAAGTVGNSNTSTVSGDTVKDTAVQQESVEDIALNQTVITENYEFTLNKVEFSYRVEPDNPPSYYTYYDAPDGEVYIYVNASIKNTQKQAIDCDSAYSVTVDYNEGYTYRGFNIANDSDGDFTYANITSVEPLQTLGVHNLIACPEEVETSENPLFLTITMKDGTKYKYTIR